MCESGWVRGPLCRLQFTLRMEGSFAYPPQIMLTFGPVGARISIYTDRGLECILPGLLISGIDVQAELDGEQNAK